MANRTNKNTTTLNDILTIAQHADEKTQRVLNFFVRQETTGLVSMYDFLMKLYNAGLFNTDTVITSRDYMALMEDEAYNGDFSALVNDIANYHTTAPLYAYKYGEFLPITDVEDLTDLIISGDLDEDVRGLINVIMANSGFYMGGVLLEIPDPYFGYQLVDYDEQCKVCELYDSLTTDEVARYDVFNLDEVVDTLINHLTFDKNDLIFAYEIADMLEDFAEDVKIYFYDHEDGRIKPITTIKQFKELMEEYDD